MPRQTDGVSFTPQFNFKDTGSDTNIQLYNSLNDRYSDILTTENGNRFESVNILDYGAVGDGTTNNNTAFANAIATGKNIYVPSGTFLLTSTQALSDGQGIWGEGASSIIKVTGNIAALSLGTNGFADNISGLGTGKDDATNPAQIFIRNTSAKYGQVITRCRANDIAGISFYVTNTTAPAHIGLAITDCFSYDSNYSFVLDYNAGEYNTVMGCQSIASNFGFFNWGGNNSIIGCEATDGDIGYQQNTATNTGHSSVVGSRFNHNTTNLLIDGEVYGMNFVGCDFQAGNIVIKNTNSITFTGCNFYTEELELNDAINVYFNSCIKRFNTAVTIIGSSSYYEYGVTNAYDNTFTTFYSTLLPGNNNFTGDNIFSKAGAINDLQFGDSASRYYSLRTNVGATLGSLRNFTDAIDLMAWTPTGDFVFIGEIDANSFKGSGADLTDIPQSAVTDLATDLSDIASDISNKYNKAGTVSNPITGSVYVTVPDGNTVEVGIYYTNYAYLFNNGIAGFRLGTAGDVNLDVYNGGSPLNAWKVSQAGVMTIPKLQTPQTPSSGDDVVNKTALDAAVAANGFLKGSTFLAQTYEVAPTTGQTVVPTRNFKSIIRPTGALAALTIQLPSSPSAGDIIWVTITQPITTISYTNGTAATAPTTLAARDEFSLVYSSVTGEWH